MILDVGTANDSFYFGYISEHVYLSFTVHEN